MRYTLFIFRTGSPAHFIWKSIYLSFMVYNLIATDIVHFPSHPWWWGPPAFPITSFDDGQQVLTEKTAKLETMMKTSARPFNIGVYKLQPLKMLDSSLHTEEQRGEINVYMFTLYMNLRIRNTWSSEKAHILTSVSSAVHFNSHPLNYVTVSQRQN